MHIIIPTVALMLLVVAAVAVKSRRRRRLARQERRVHELYLKTKRRDWLARWRRQNKTKRLTYVPTDSE